MTGRLRDYAQRFATLAAPPRAHTCTPMLCSQGSSPPAQHPQAPTTLRAPGLTALLQRTNMPRTPVALSAFNISASSALPTVASPTSLACHWDSCSPEALHST